VAEELTPEQLAGMAEARRKAVEGMSEQELEEMRARRAAMMPKE